MNAALGSIGTTAFWRPLNDAPLASAMQAFMKDAESGSFEAIIVLDANPAHDVEGFAAAYAKAAHRIHLGAHNNETGMASTWHLPAAHWLEAWNDVTNGDGSISIAQPLVMPLFGGRNTIEVLSALSGSFTPARGSSGSKLLGQHRGLAYRPARRCGRRFGHQRCLPIDGGGLGRSAFWCG